MNVRQTMKAAAIAIPMMFSHGKAAAQEATMLAQDTAKVVATDTLKVMDQASADARMLFNKVDSIARSKADSIASTKSDSIQGKKPRFAFDAEYISARHLPQDGVRVHASARKNKDVFDVTGIFSGKHLRATMLADASYTRRFPVKKTPKTSVDLTGSVGGTATIVRTHDPVSDQYGIWTPRLTGGVNYKKYFAKSNSAVLRLKAEAGPAVNIKSVAQTHGDNNKVKAAWYLNAEAEAGSTDSLKKHPQVSAIIGGGHHPTIGANIYGGFRYRF